jgi:hypothetical protein
MATSRKKPGTPAEYAAFSGVLKTVLQVSHSELQARLQAQKEAKKRKIKRASSSRAAAERS